MKRCWWLKKRNKKKIARICVKNVNYFTDESGQAFGPAQTVCKYTCESCDPCYEDRKSKFIFEKKNGDFVNKACKKATKRNHCKQEHVNSAKTVCPVSCEVDGCT